MKWVVRGSRILFVALILASIAWPPETVAGCWIEVSVAPAAEGLGPASDGDASPVLVVEIKLFPGTALTFGSKGAIKF